MSTRPALTLILVSALALSACGGDDESATPTPSPSTSASPTASASASPVQDASACDAAKQIPPFPGVVAANQNLKEKPTIVAGPKPDLTELTYFDIVEGSGEELRIGGTAEVKYVGAFYDTGKEFDSSYSRGADETLSFKACFPGVIPGFSIGAIGMQVGGRRQINIPAPFGYGEAGSGEAIPPNSDLIFIVDLVSVS